MLDPYAISFTSLVIHSMLSTSGYTLTNFVTFLPHRYDDIYHLYMTFTDGTSKERRSTNISKCVANFFDENGTLCVDLFHPVVEKMRDSLSSEKKGD